MRDVTGAVAVPLSRRRPRSTGGSAPRSYMIVPLVARGRTIGALTLLSMREGRHYGDSDLDFAQHLGRRFALAVDNARLYDEAERSRGLLDTLFASAPVGLGYFDTDLRCVRVNEALAAINGVPVDDHPGRPLAELLGPARRPRPAALPARARERRADPRAGGGGQSPGAPGERRHWLVSCTPVRGGDGATLGVSSVVIDVTERRALLERERAARRRASFLARASELLESSLDYETTHAQRGEHRGTRDRGLVRDPRARRRRARSSSWRWRTPTRRRSGSRGISTGATRRRRTRRVGRRP